MSGSRLVNRNVIAGNGRTSMRLEPELWEALREICLREDIDIAGLIRKVEAQGHAGGRTSAIRVHIVQYFRALSRPPAMLDDPGMMEAMDGKPGLESAPAYGYEPRAA